MKAKKTGGGRPQRPESPWKENLLDDCRPSLAALESQQWDLEFAYSCFSRPLSDVVSSLHFSSHHRWGLPAKPEEIRHLSKEFLQWMSHDNRWLDFKSAVQETTDPAPTRFYLARFYARFKKDRPLDSNFSKDEPSFSSRRSLLELPTSELSQQVIESTMGAFASLTQKLPNKTRLIYDLHLEGLLNHEISWLTGHSEGEAASLVREAKEFLLGLASGGSHRREGT